MKLEFGLIPMGVAGVTVHISTLVVLRFLPSLLHIWVTTCIFFRTNWAEKCFTKTLLWVRMCSLHDLNQGNVKFFQFANYNSSSENQAFRKF